MTQDQYGQTRGPGYVVRGDAVPERRERRVRQRAVQADDPLPEGGFGSPRRRPERDEVDQTAQAADRGRRRLSGRRLLGRARCVHGRPGRGGRRHHSGGPVPASATYRCDDVNRTGTDPLTRQDRVTGQASPDAADHPATSRTCSAPPGARGQRGRRQRRTRRIRSARRPSRTSRPMAPRPMAPRRVGPRPMASRQALSGR